MIVSSRPRFVDVARTIATDPAHLWSLARLPLAFIVWLRPTDKWFVLGVLAMAALTDVLDGRVGRRTHQAAISQSGTHHVGAWLDPLCDKLFISSAALAVLSAMSMSWWLLPLVLLRDLALLPMTLVFRLVGGADRFHGHDFRARWSGKATTGLQGATCASALFYPAAVWPLAIAAAVVGLVAVVERVVLAFSHRR
jgi:phosphatidylglycerophosphate synthase